MSSTWVQPTWNKLKILKKTEEPVEVTPDCMLAVFAEWSWQELSCHVPVHEGMKEATLSNLLDPALDTTPPSVRYVYDQLMMELRREDEAAFINFMRMLPQMFDELLHRMPPASRRDRQTNARRLIVGTQTIAGYMDGGRVNEGRQGRWKNDRITL